MTAGLVGMALLTMACGPSEEELNRLIDQRARAIVEAVPTVTPVAFPTPLPTVTPVAFPTPPPTVTPVAFPTAMPTVTPVPTPTPPLTATPQPTATRMVLPATPTPQPINDFREVRSNAWPSVFMLDTLRGHGTGWLIEPGLIVTNEHVVRGSDQVIVRQSLHPSFQAAVLGFNRSKDIALLQFEQSGAQLHPGASPLAMGQITTDNAAETLLALGYSGSGVWPNGTVGSASANVGVLSQVSNFGQDSFGVNLKMDAPVDPGDSGGPVLNYNGEVVGMIRSAEERTSGGQRVVGTFFAVHVDEIRDALPDLKRGVSQ